MTTHRLFGGVLSTAAALLMLGGAVLGFMELMVYRDPLRVINDGEHFATQTSKNAITVGRHFEVFNDVDVVFHRFLDRCEGGQEPKCDGGLLTIIPIPSEPVQFPAGKRRLHTVVGFADLPPGVYNYHTKICWSYGWLGNCLVPPVLDVEIKE